MRQLSYKKVKLRKGRRCGGCGRWLLKGEVVAVQVNVDGSDIWSFYTCDCCEYIIERFKIDEIYENQLEDLVKEYAVDPIVNFLLRLREVTE